MSGVEAAVERARESAGDKDVNIMGGAQIIRQALAAGIVDELSIIIAPVVLGGGKRLFREADEPRRLTLIDCKATSTGGVMLTYRPA